jgi:hypothetical protein
MQDPQPINGGHAQESINSKRSHGEQSQQLEPAIVANTALKMKR